MQHLITIRGPIGAGKTSVMREVAEILPNTSAIELDAVKRMVDPKASSAWRRQVALDAGVNLASLLLQRDRSVVTETHARWTEQTERFKHVAAVTPGVIFHSVLVTAPYDVCKQRIGGRILHDISYPIDEQMAQDYYTNLDPLDGETVIDTSQISVQKAAERIIAVVIAGGA